MIRGAVFRTVMIAGLLAWPASSPAVGEEADPEPPTPRPLAVSVWQDPEEAAAVLAELEAAGAVVTAEDWRRLGLTPEGDAPSMPSAELRRWELRWREYRRPDGYSSPLGRLRGVTGRWQASLRWRRGSDGEAETRASVQRRGEALHLVGGGAGIHHGLGLLCAAPGRWTSLSAGKSLLAGRQGLRSWSGSAVAAGVDGGGLGYRIGAVGGEVLTGRFQVAPDAASATDISLGRLHAKRGAAGCSVLAGRFGASRGGSLVATWTSGDVAVIAESAAWRLYPESEVQRAWGVCTRFRGDRGAIEAQIASAAAADGAPLAERCAVLPGWDGSGWALRLQRRPLPGVSVQVLVFGGRHRHFVADEFRTRRDLRFEISAKMATGPRRSLQLRHRVVRRRDFGRGDRPPWLGVVEVDVDCDEQTILSWRRDRDDLRLQVSARTLCRLRLDGESSIDSAPRQRRNLVAGRCVWQASPRMRLVVSTACAWGDPVDLVSAAVPVGGVILPRHWGRWAAESSVGGEGVFGSLAVQFGAAARFPDGDAAGPPRMEYFLCLLRRPPR